jgi:hypothetical protein
MKAFLLLGLLLIGTAVECRDRNGNAQEIDKSEARVVAYGKALDVAKLDPALPSQRFDDWLSSGPPKIDSLEWSSGCDLKLEGPEPRDGWPLCVKARLRRHDLWGWVLVTIGTTRSGIHGEPRVTHIVMTSRALAMKGQFRNAEMLSELPRLIVEVEEAEKALKSR